MVSDKVQLDKDKMAALCLILLIEKEHEVDIFLVNCDHLLGFEFHVMTFLVVSHTQSQCLPHMKSHSSPMHLFHAMQSVGLYC